MSRSQSVKRTVPTFMTETMQPSIDGVNAGLHRNSWQLYRMGVASDRVLLLVEQVRKEVGGRGWQTRVGQRLAVDQSTISRWCSGKGKGPDLETIEHLIKHCRIRPEFFFAPTLPKDAHYSAFKVPRLVAEPTPPKELVEFIDKAIGAGAPSPTPRERVWLASLPWPERPTERAYWLALEALRATYSLEQTIHGT